MSDPKLILVAAIACLLTSPFVYLFVEGWQSVLIGFFFMVVGILLFWKATKSSRATTE